MIVRGSEGLSHTESAGRFSYTNLHGWCAFCVFVFSLVGWLFQGVISPKIHSIPFLKKVEHISISHELTHQNLSPFSWVTLGIPGDGSGPCILHLDHRGDGGYYMISKKLSHFLSRTVIGFVHTSWYVMPSQQNHAQLACLQSSSCSEAHFFLSILSREEKIWLSTSQFRVPRAVHLYLCLQCSPVSCQEGSRNITGHTSSCLGKII